MALEREFTFRNTSLPQCSYNVFVDMRNQKKFCDIELNIGTQRISAHRVILAAGMPLFRETFSNDAEISVPNIDPTTFEYLLEYIYSCELKITINNVKGLLSGSCVLQMNDVQDACCDFLYQGLQPQNVLSFRDLANDLNIPTLKECVEVYVKENFEQVSRTEEFLNCPFEYVRELIGKDDLNVVSEETALNSVLRWVKASVDERKSGLPELLGQVRMVLLKPLYLTELVEGEELIRKSVTCRDLVDEAKNYDLFPEKRRKSCSFITKPREFMKISDGAQETDAKLYCLKINLKYVAQQFDLINKTWQTKVSMEYRIGHGSVAEFNRKIYLCHDAYSLQCDPKDHKYQVLLPLTVSRMFTATASLRNKIFICGGRTSQFVASDAVECFDAEKNELKQVKCLQKARWGLKAVSLGNYIYALGGMDSHNIYDTVERYNFVLNKWQYVSPMLTQRIRAGAAVFNGRIYVCGGCENLTGNQCLETAEMYDPVTNKWKFISSMNRARKELTLLVFSGKLYAIGSYGNDKKLLKSCEVYDSLFNMWEYDLTFDGPGDACEVVLL